MRVGLFTFRILEKPTGLANYVRSLAYALRHVDDRVEVILLNPHIEAPPSWYSDFPTYPLRSVLEPSNPAYILLTAPFKLELAARRLRLDVVHAPANVAPFANPFPVSARIATVHDVAPLGLPLEHRTRAILGYALGIPQLRWTADAIICDSTAAAHDLVRFAHLPSRTIQVIPAGTDPISPDDLLLARRRAPAIKKAIGVDGPYFLAVGDVRPRKNLLRVIQAFEMVQERLPNARLVIVGQDMHRSDEIARAAANVPGIVRLGYVDDEQLDALYAGASALVFPSLYEGFGLPILEAMARGTPVITSDVSSMPEVAGQAALLVNPYDPAAIANAMASVASDKVLARRLSKAGRERAAQFTWDETARRTLAVYEEAVSRSRSGSRRPGA